jgi:hypothetical protein
MPGTRRHQRTDAGVRPPLGGTKALGDVLHLHFGRQPTRWAARVVHFHPERPSKPALERQRASCEYGVLDGRLAVLGVPDASTWMPAAKTTSPATRLGNDAKAFLICLTFEVRGGLRLGARRPLD